MASNQSTHKQGSVKDPAHDGRLKENREAGQTKGTTEGSRHRAEENGKQADAKHASSSHSASSHSGESHGSGTSHAKSGGSDDLKSREYKDEKGEVHHHTKAYMEGHKGE